MKKLVLALLLATPLSVSANTYTFGVGDVDYINHYSDSNKYTVSFGYEAKQEHPWFTKYTYVPDYGKVKQHHSIEVGKQGRSYINDNMFLYLGGSLLLNNRETVRSSSRLNAGLELGIGTEHIRFGIKHVSNAYQSDVNKGEDFLMLTVAF